MSQPLARSEALHDRVRAVIERASIGDASRREADIEELFLDVARFQLEHVEPVGRLHRSTHGHRLPTSSAEIVALPTDVFRLRRVAAHPEGLDVRVFRTSGTTQGLRGAHPFRTLRTYESAAMTAAESLFFGSPRPTRALVLAPSSKEVPDSSLSFMIDLFVERLGLRTDHLVGAHAAPDAARLRSAMEEAARSGEVTMVLGTSFAFVHAVDLFGDRGVELAQGSFAMLTGGFKGRSREVPEGELRAAIRGLLGLGDAGVVGEYGMTELSSQLYETWRAGPCLGGAAEASVYRPPPWVRVEAVDPDSLRPLPRGTRGIARILDLANVDSSVAIQTQDAVEVSRSGDVKLFGRAPGATPRGCSLAIEELLATTGEHEAGSERP